VINFWASWCLPCRAEAPALQQVWQAYRDKGVVFLGVLLQGDNREEAQTFLRDMGISYPHGQDDDGTLATAFQVSGVPTTFILNTEGRLVQRMIGPITAAYLRRRLEQVVVR
jgi:cytochrome c biogenesis protein CcmG/thiol:disulfide interchange protein DsbE